MAEQATIQEVPTADASKPPQDAKTREVSKIAFPYSDLTSAVEVAKAVQHVGGLSCTWDQLAAQMGQAATGGGFSTRVATAKTFGLVSYGGGNVSLTKLGSRMCDPEQEAQAKAEAFLCVPLYAKIHEHFKGLTLPPPAGLESEMGNLGVAPKQKERARQVFMKSAMQAGFFAFGPTKLVAPAFKGGSSSSQQPKEPETPAQTPNGGAGGNGGGDDGKKRHPFIEGLLETLPPAAPGTQKSEWSVQERQDWLQTAAGIFNLIYKVSDDDKGASVSVSFARPSNTSAN
jgi:hypothetical protein